MNYLMIAGHLGADPEVRVTQTGKKVTTFRVASKGKKDETIWWRVTIWGDQFDKMIPHLKKGSGVIVTGEMQKAEIFMDKEGKPQVSHQMTAHNISFSPFGKGRGAEEGSNSFGTQANTFGKSENVGSFQEASFSLGGDPFQSSGFTDDEIPF